MVNPDLLIISGKKLIAEQGILQKKILRMILTKNGLRIIFQKRTILIWQRN